MIEEKSIIKDAPHIFDKWNDPEFRERLREEGYGESIVQLDNTNEEDIARYLASISDFSEESIFQKVSGNSYSIRSQKNTNYTPDIEVKKINEREYIIRYNSKTVDSRFISRLEEQLGQIA